MQRPPSAIRPSATTAAAAPAIRTATGDEGIDNPPSLLRKLSRSTIRPPVLAILNPIFRLVVQVQTMPPLPLSPATPAPAKALAVAALPFILFSGSLSGWGAAAGIAACLIAVAAAIGRQHLAMSLGFGLAVAFNVHALVLAPFFLAIAIRDRAGIRTWLVAPSIWLALVLPWLIAGGRPANFNPSVGDAPGIWSIATAILPEQAPQLVGLALAASLGTAATFVARMQIVPLDRRELIGMASLSSLLTAGLFPGIRPDAFILAAILTLTCAATRPGRSALLIAGLVQAGLFATIGVIPGASAVPVAVGAFCMIAATWIAAQPLIAPHANDNRDGSHRIPPAYGLHGTLSFDMMSARPARSRGSNTDVRKQDA